jgi:leucyl-tRNA synthetase
MSKSRGNVIVPDRLVEEQGSDAFRMTLMFQGSYTDGYDWNDNGIFGIKRFLNRIWKLYAQILKEDGAYSGRPESPKTSREREVLRVLNSTVKSVTEDLERFSFNTAISRMMEFVNALYKHLDEVPEQERNPALLAESLKTLNLLLAPFAPHLGEELWNLQAHKSSVFLESWPGYDEELCMGEQITIVVQVNGKLRAEFQGPLDITEAMMKERALAHPKIQTHLEGKSVKKVITVPKKLVNIVC